MLMTSAHETIVPKKLNLTLQRNELETWAQFLQIVAKEKGKKRGYLMYNIVQKEVVVGFQHLTEQQRDRSKYSHVQRCP